MALTDPVRAGRPVAFVLRALGLGDLLTAVPAVRAVRAALPGHHLVLGVPAALAGFAGLVGAVDSVAPTEHLDPPRSWPGPYRRVAVAVNLHGRGPRSHRLLHRLDPAELVAFAHPEIPGGGPPWRDDEHEVGRWCRLVAARFGHADPGALDLAPPPVPSPAPGAVVVHPGTGLPARRWPPDRFAAVAAALHRDGHRVVVTGSAGERRLAAGVAEAAGIPAAVLTGLPAPDLAALVAGARLVVCGDTGIGHLATAYRTPSVLIFGPVPPARWGPPPRPYHAVVWSGRTGDPFAADPDPGLLEIPPARVLAAARTVLDREPARDPARDPARTASPAGPPPLLTRRTS